MDIEFYGGSVQGNATAPPSKSCTHRAIILAALAGGSSLIRNALCSDDIEATVSSVKSIGSTVFIRDPKEGELVVSSFALHAPRTFINAGNSGTTLRLMTGVAALFQYETYLTGDASVCKRPMQPLLDALSSCGAECTSTDGHAPLTIKGPINPETVSVDGSMSSQFVSSILMILPLMEKPVEINVEGKRTSEPYIDMTVEIMRRFGASVQKTDSGYTVEPTGYKPAVFTVPGDWSSAAFLLAAGCLSGEVTVDGLDGSIPQGDARIIDLLKQAGASVTVQDSSVTCRSSGRLRSVDADLSSTPDLFPIMAVLMSVAEGTSILYGAPNLRYKETDRIETTVSMLKALGADVTATDDGCIINGKPKLKGGRIEHGGDHRVMMAAAIASLVSDGPVSMEDDGCWRVSYPDFIETMRSLGLRC